jgi:hypothetical protein
MSDFDKLDFNTPPKEKKPDKNKQIEDSIKATEIYNAYAEADQYEKLQNDKIKLQNQFNYYFVVYFDTDKEKNDFCEKNKFDYDFVYGEDLAEKLKGDNL